MIWVDRTVKKILERKLPLEWVDDMKTPSGRIHVGALCGIVIHDLLYKALSENTDKTTFTYVFDDQDPMDALPSYLDEKKWGQYSGMQLYKIPSPEKGFDSFAQYYAQEFIDVFNSINCHPKIIWGSELYNSGKMNDVIKEVLDNTETIRNIYKKVTKKDRPKDWHPFSVVCENCKKIGTTLVYAWDGTDVSYRCIPDMVKWAKGCGHEGKISPLNGNGKIPWKVEWPAKWKVIGVTVEGAGKDHMSAGGSHDIAKEICKEVLHYPVPYEFPYEWFIIGGRKMSSSKGIGVSAKEVSQILPPDVFRFLIVRSPVERTLDFDPFGDTIPNLFDDYDRCLNAHFDKIENKIPEGKQGEVLLDFARIVELSEVKPLPKKRVFLPRFRTLANQLRTGSDPVSYFEKQKGSSLTPEEKNILEERITYAKIYLKTYAVTDDESSDQSIKLSPVQKQFLTELSESLSKSQKTDAKHIQDSISQSIQTTKCSPRDAFKALYIGLTGKPYGPKAVDLITELGIEEARSKLKEI